MIQSVDRLQIEQERWVVVLFHDCRCRQGGFDAVRSVVGNDPPESSQCVSVQIVGQGAKIVLNLERRSATRDNGPLFGCEV